MGRAFSFGLFLTVLVETRVNTENKACRLPSLELKAREGAGAGCEAWDTLPTVFAWLQGHRSLPNNPERGQCLFVPAVQKHTYLAQGIP